MNPYSEKLKNLAGIVYCDRDTELHAGNWRFVFRKSSPELHVEIGCNAGHVLLGWAQRNPHRSYIGIDWKFKPIFRGAKKAMQLQLDNVFFFRAHAERIPFMFGKSEIDCIYLFFPDPWPKKSQQKHRFLTTDRLLDLASVVKPNGLIHIKTDHQDYFDWIKKAALETGNLWTIEHQTEDLYENDPHPEFLEIPDVTLFEKIYIHSKIPIRNLILRRKPAPGLFSA